MFKHITALIPECPITHDNAFLDADEAEDLDGESDDEGQTYPVVSIRHLPKYGSRTEDDHAKVPKGLTQEERNKDHLMEFFAGWAMCHSEKFRKFTIVTRLPHLDRWKKWHHVSGSFP